MRESTKEEPFVIEWTDSNKQGKKDRKKLLHKLLYVMIKVSIISILFIGALYYLFKYYVQIPGEDNYWDDIFLKAAPTTLLLIPLFLFQGLALSFVTTNYKLSNKGLKISGNRTGYWRWKVFETYNIRKEFIENHTIYFLEIYHKKSKLKPIEIILPEESDKRQEIISKVSSLLKEYKLPSKAQPSNFDVDKETTSMLATILPAAILVIIFIPIHFDGKIDFSTMNKPTLFISTTLPVAIWLLLNLRKLIKHKEMRILALTGLLISHLLVGLGLVIRILNNMLELAK